MIEKRSCKKEWFDSAEDKEDSEAMRDWYNTILDHEYSNKPYSFCDTIPWWHTIDNYEKSCKDFLLCLAALPVW